MTTLLERDYSNTYALETNDKKGSDGKKLQILPRSRTLVSFKVANY
jgi:hypothetical protein